jgi:hypothetical protein
MYKVGVDPGWSNLGLSVLDEHNTPILSVVLTPSNAGTISAATREVEDTLAPYWGKITSAAVEKYVVYGRGVPSKAGIDTTMMVGALQYMFYSKGVEPQLYRAIDWKQSVCKQLFKEKGFKNPSDSFDKKFSYAAALCICSKDFDTDHEADAACLAYQSSLQKQKR